MLLKNVKHRLEFLYHNTTYFTYFLHPSFEFVASKQVTLILSIYLCFASMFHIYFTSLPCALAFCILSSVTHIIPSASGIRYIYAFSTIYYIWKSFFSLSVSLWCVFVCGKFKNLQYLKRWCSTNPSCVTEGHTLYFSGGTLLILTLYC